MKESRLAQTVERKKLLQKNLLKLEQKINNLKGTVERKINLDMLQVKYSPMSRGRPGKIPKMSEDLVS